MATTQPKKPKQTPEDLEVLKSEVASFASSLGLAPPSATAVSSSSYGFDDSDFRKSGLLKPKPSPTDADASATAGEKKIKKGPDSSKPIPKPHPLQIDPFSNTSEKKKNNVSDLPLMKASSLSAQWYVDAEELELKFFGADSRKKVAALGMEEMKRLVEEKKEVAKRLVEQYTADYESFKRKSSDMRLLEVTTKSGTSADKVSAFMCLVQDNPIANMRSLDALVCEFLRSCCFYHSCYCNCSKLLRRII